MSGAMSSEASVEPNLTPMLDMVFQLITFFMLVVNFKAAAIDQELRLPVVGSARMVNAENQQLLVLNLDARGVLRAYGEVQPDIERFVRDQAQQSAQSASRQSAGAVAHGEPAAVVVIRADEATEFKRLNRLIRACQDNGFANFAFKTASRAEQQKRARRSAAGT